MKRKLISLGIIGLITTILIFVGVATGAVSYRSEKDNINFGGNYLFSGTSVEFTGTTVAINSDFLSLTSGQTLLETANFTFTGSDTTFSSTTSTFSGTTTDFSGTTVILEPTWTRIIGTYLVVSSAETHTGTESHSGVITNTSVGTYSGENTFSGGVTVTGTAKLNGRVQQDWVTPTYVAGYGYAISGTTSYKSLFKIDASLGVGIGGASAPGTAGLRSGATVVLPTITADMDGWELTFIVVSGTTTVWFLPTTGTIQTTSGTTGLNIASQPNLTGDSVTWVAAYQSGVSWYAKGTFIQ